MPVVTERKIKKKSFAYPVYPRFVKDFLPSETVYAAAISAMPTISKSEKFTRHLIEIMMYRKHGHVKWHGQLDYISDFGAYESSYQLEKDARLRLSSRWRWFLRLRLMRHYRRLACHINYESGGLVYHWTFHSGRLMVEERKIKDYF